jgi:hypothetical protein
MSSEVEISLILSPLKSRDSSIELVLSEVEGLGMTGPYEIPPRGAGKTNR